MSSYRIIAFQEMAAEGLRTFFRLCKVTHDRDNTPGHLWKPEPVSGHSVFEMKRQLLAMSEALSKAVYLSDKWPLEALSIHDLTPLDKLTAVQIWQDYPYMHPLSCTNGCGKLKGALDPETGLASLVCPSCGHMTFNIPDTVLEAYIFGTLEQNLYDLKSLGFKINLPNDKEKDSQEGTQKGNEKHP